MSIVYVNLIFRVAYTKTHRIYINEILINEYNIKHFLIRKHYLQISVRSLGSLLIFGLNIVVCVQGTAEDGLG